MCAGQPSSDVFFDQEEDEMKHFTPTPKLSYVEIEPPDPPQPAD